MADRDRRWPGVLLVLTTQTGQRIVCMPAFDWQFPYASYRKPILARNIVATASRCGASRAAHAAQRPQRSGCGIGHRHRADRARTGFNGIGSDAFAIVWDGTAAWPQRLGPLARGVDAGILKDHKTMPQRGWNTGELPGCVRAWVAAVGALRQTAFRRAVRPAIGYAATATWSRPPSPTVGESGGRSCRHSPPFRERSSPGGPPACRARN